MTRLHLMIHQLHQMQRVSVTLKILYEPLQLHFVTEQLMNNAHAFQIKHQPKIQITLQTQAIPHRIPKPKRLQSTNAPQSTNQKSRERRNRSKNKRCVISKTTLPLIQSCPNQILQVPNHVSIMSKPKSSFKPQQHKIQVSKTPQFNGFSRLEKSN